jgi:uncharacterized membrane protein
VLPGDFIFFGILHQIAFASVLGLAFLRLPAAATLTATVVVILAPQFLRSSLFDHPALWWVGLSAAIPRSNDYVPLFPWFGAVLAGIGVARLFAGSFRQLAEVKVPNALGPLLFAGRHSLAFYLVHQPVLIAMLWLFSQLMPPVATPPEAQFRQACERTCAGNRVQTFCAAYCGCMVEKLQAANALDSVFSDAQNAALQRKVQEMAMACTTETDDRALEGGGEGAP